MGTMQERLRRTVDPLDTTYGDPPAARRRAAVLLLFDVTQPELPLLFLERAGHLRHHAGQIGFPGGGAEPGDRDVVATALREAGEEAGVPGSVEPIGLLPPFLTATSDNWLTPVLAFQTEVFELKADGVEVARLFRVGLTELITAPHTVRRLTHEGTVRSVDFYEVAGTVIWGVTGSIIAELLRRLSP